MIIATKDFGQLAVDASEVLRFAKGLFAFEDTSEFVLIEKDGYLQKWLQAVKGEDPRFIVFDPADILENYHPTIPLETLEKLEIGADDDFRLYLIAVIPEDIKNMTLNLKSPLVINPHKHLGIQIILEEENYPVRYCVFEEEEGRA